MDFSFLKIKMTYYGKKHQRIYKLFDECNLHKFMNINVLSRTALYLFVNTLELMHVRNSDMTHSGGTTSVSL